MKLFHRISIALLTCLSVAVFFAAPAQAGGGSRTYWYDRISTTIKVNTDTTIDVAETQTYHFVGSYHVGWRAIPFNKIDTVSDVRVIDAETQKSLIDVSPQRLEKTDPASWGKFTTYRENGNQNIEWYYNLADTEHTWILQYRVRGAIEFQRNFDRLYWNVFTDYDVPVIKANAMVLMPYTLTDPLKIQTAAYRTGGARIAQSVSPYQAYDAANFSAEEFSAHEAFTIDVAWPRGAIDRNAYWHWYAGAHLGGLGATALPIITFLIGLIWWLARMRNKQGRGTIVPQYEPPEHLKPAIAQVLVLGQLTSVGLAATVVDLAIRGYVRIEEKPSAGILKNVSPRLFVVGLTAVLLIIFAMSAPQAIPYLLFFGFWMMVALRGAARRDYTLIKLKPYENDSTLAPYEREYLDMLFRGTDEFSTAAMRLDTSRQREMYYAIQNLNASVYAEAGSETNAFTDVSFLSKNKKIIGIGATMAFYVSVMVIRGAGELALQWVFFAISTVACALGLWLFIKFQTRLTKQGEVLREEWLGFRMYLSVAEKYRMQNLTPDLFEKYLPYAMIFGVEKKWAKAFAGMQMAPPTWYVGGVYVSAGGGGGFSPSAFSTSFSSSFSSAFSSSAGGAGGGGAGGGGGGGGGGAG